VTPAPEDVLAAVEPLLLPYLERQTWFREARRAVSAGARRPVTVTSGEVLREGSAGVPGLARLVLSCEPLRLQVTVGWREAAEAASVLRGRESAILGAPSVEGAGEVLLYDAIADEELLRVLLSVASSGAAAGERARLVESLTSHASVVYDDRLFMKLYRVLEPSPRAEVEVLTRLDEVGFNYIVAPVAVWRDEEADLALVREFWAGGVEGRALALTSLRDLLGEEHDAPAPEAELAAARAGGDLASETRRLGEMTARLHLALAAAFGEHEVDPGALAAAVAGVEPELASRVPEVAASGRAGRSIRVHGDYHLRRVMRTDAGWIVVGFGDDPSRAARLAGGGRGAFGTPLDDVADLCLSFDQVAAEASTRDDDPVRSRELAAAWARRNRAALLEGYLAVAGVDRLLPPDRADLDLLLTALSAARDRRAGNPLQ
jgi:maltokinase